jgi:hypothetical protein
VIITSTPGFRIKADMDKVEKQLADAESSLPMDATLQPLRAFIKPSLNIFVSVSWKGTNPTIVSYTASVVKVRAGAGPGPSPRGPGFWAKPQATP